MGLLHISVRTVGLKCNSRVNPKKIPNKLSGPKFSKRRPRVNRFVKVYSGVKSGLYNRLNMSETITGDRL